MSVAVVFSGGPAAPALGRLDIPEDAVVIAADRGLDHARALGFTPKLLVGDLDSVSAEGLAWAREVGVIVDEHPADKDETDLELAVAAAAHICDDVIVLDGGDGRLDHLLANITVLTSERFAALHLRATLGHALVTVVRDTARLVGTHGDLVSLFAVGGAAFGVTTTGLRWPLHEAQLMPGSTLGVSNEFVDTEATLVVDDGVVVAIQP